MTRSKLAIGDADALVALADAKDANNARALKASRWLLANGYEVIFPNTAIVEAITALKRGKNLPKEAHILNKQYQEGVYIVEFITEDIQKRASERFEKTSSKKNTIFDAIVIETAIDLEADYIFSFDDWYRKEGFHLVPQA